jgi:bacteriorhodopsin
VGLSQVSKGTEMNTTQTLAFVTVMAVFVGVSLFFAMQPNSPQQQNAECLSAATAIPLVNTTTGVGMTAVVAECDQG